MTGIVEQFAGEDDVLAGLIAKYPFEGKSVKKPRPAKQKVIPWPEERVWAVRSALHARFRVLVDLAGGLGLRQGECFGLALDDVDFLRGVVRVRRQVKTVRTKRVFALPKYDKEREIPLPEHGRYENGMHELRHFFASTLLDQGESIKAVAGWLGIGWEARFTSAPP